MGFFCGCHACGPAVSLQKNGFEVNLTDFLVATGLYILPNMLMIVCVYGLISLLLKNLLPAVPFWILYMVYSNTGNRNVEGVYGYYGRRWLSWCGSLTAFLTLCHRQWHCL